MKKKWYQRLQEWLIKQFASIHWHTKVQLTDTELATIQKMCAKTYFIIATRRKNYFSTTMIAFGNFVLTGKWGYFSHVLMNLEDEVDKVSDFRFIEATGTGVHFSTFSDVFNPVQSVALLVPVNMSVTEWTNALDRAKTYLGRPYDNLLDLRNDLEINCVELVRLALEGTDNYATNFAEFEKLVAQKKKLTPDMFVNCSDFRIIYEIKK